MKLYQVLLLAAAASPALASERAAGYEAVMFYDVSLIALDDLSTLSTVFSAYFDIPS